MKKVSSAPKTKHAPVHVDPRVGPRVLVTVMAYTYE
jgi:hypothetical protein